MASRKQTGFSLMELLIVISCSLIMAAVVDVSLQPLLMQQHVDDAYNTTLNSLRRARDLAAMDMRTYIVTFSPAVPGVSGGTIKAVDPNTGVVLFNQILPP